ncbi:MAG: DUF541 domain-containing protein [Phycisphaera sp.]|nr:DUF541 domain-containing protein [Phycisphaera sp.]
MRLQRIPGFTTIGLLAVMLVGVAPPAARAADPASGITVVGLGHASQAPTVVEIPAMISGEAPLAADAIVKYRGAKQQALKALGELKVPGLKIEEQGFRIAHSTNAQQMMQMMMQGNVQQKMQQKVLVYEEVNIVLENAPTLKPDELMDTLVKVVDAAKDAGLITTGRELSMIEMQMSRGTPTSLVSFKIADPSKLYEAAQEKAYADALRKAERLAKLAGLKLGRAVSIQESTVSNNDTKATGAVSWYAMMLAASDDDEKKDSGSDVFAEVSRDVQLTVTFETKAE